MLSTLFSSTSSSSELIQIESELALEEPDYTTYIIVGIAIAAVAVIAAIFLEIQYGLLSSCLSACLLFAEEEPAFCGIISFFLIGGSIGLYLDHYYAEPSVLPEVIPTPEEKRAKKASDYYQEVRKSIKELIKQSRETESGSNVTLTLFHYPRVQIAFQDAVHQSKIALNSKRPISIPESNIAKQEFDQAVNAWNDAVKSHY